MEYEFECGIIGRSNSNIGDIFLTNMIEEEERIIHSELFRNFVFDLCHFANFEDAELKEIRDSINDPKFEFIECSDFGGKKYTIKVNDSLKHSFKVRNRDLFYLIK
jgi:hypothetical protein